MSHPPRLITGADFLSGVQPPSYVLEPILQRGQIAALTALTNHGKSAVTYLFALMVALGQSYPHLKARKGRVLLMFGENADNAAIQFLATCQYYGVPLEVLRDCIVVYRFNKPIRQALIEIFNEARDGAWGEFALVIVDTSAAYFDGEDENSNAALREHAAMQRTLTRLPGHPAALTNCHPTKKASKDDLVPRGGGAFLNELDANLTLWNDGTVVTVHHTKMRGPPFDPIAFRLVDHQLKLGTGAAMSVPVAVAVDDVEQLRLMGEQSEDETAMLAAMRAAPSASTRDWAAACGWTMQDGTPYHVKAARVLKRLEGAKKVKRVGSRWMTSH